jgi:ABC-type bacteriocin/lantibiotic exporter with double-glycine peptidase domain
MRPYAETAPLRDAFRQFGRLLGIVRGYWGQLARGMLLGVVVGVVAMATPYLSKLLIDEVYPAENVTLMHVLVGALLAVGVSVAVLGAVRAYYTVHVSSRLAHATGLMFFNHLQHLPARFFDEHRVGEVMSRFGDVRMSLGSISNVFGTFFTQGIYLLLVPPFLFLLNWRLALVALAAVPFTVLVTALSARALRRRYKRTAEAFAELSAAHVEVFSHIRTLKGLGMEHEIYRRTHDQSHDVLRHQLSASAAAQGFQSLNTVIQAAGTAALTWFGWTLILRGEMTLGTLIAFLAYVTYLVGPLQQLITLYSEFQQTAVSLGRMFEYLDTAPEQDTRLAYAPPAPLTRPLRGEVELRGVTFGYAAERPVLRDVDLALRPGEVTAIVGASGVGKSSLLRLVCRMLDPDEGEVRIDGIPVRELPLSELRRQVTVVWQDVSLLKGTLRENLTLGASDPPQSRVEEAVRLCRLDGLIRDLPAGYETPVAEWGASLSGGQRQRVALARALVRDAPVLLLDEATSNVDAETESEILPALFATQRHRTVAFVTHRMATAAWADRVVVLHEGRVVDSGPHAEVMDRCEAYRRMHGASAEDARPMRVLQTVR